jgi:hypothetical protein
VHRAGEHWEPPSVGARLEAGVNLSHALAKVAGPVVVLQAYQMKLGYRIPGDLPVVVDASHQAPDRKILAAWLHNFLALATYGKRRTAVYVFWGDRLEQVP